jgi:hypothetical protein
MIVYEKKARVRRAKTSAQAGGPVPHAIVGDTHVDRPSFQSVILQWFGLRGHRRHQHIVTGPGIIDSAIGLAFSRKQRASHVSASAFRCAPITGRRAVLDRVITSGRQ